ncbi:MAG: hypothetical protein R3B72_26080 [Polyangiaceae bacterium]
MYPLVSIAPPSPLRPLVASVLALLLGCGIDGKPTQGEGPEVAASQGGADPSGQGGADLGGQGGDGSGAGNGSGSSASGSGSSGSGSSGSGNDGGIGDPTCAIMASNIACKSCLEANCCEVVHECLDADLLGCVSCLDAFMDGDPTACDTSIGHNDWLAECVEYNCLDACAP